MSSAGSVIHWIGQLKAGDHAAAQKLWEGYFERPVGLGTYQTPAFDRSRAVCRVSLRFVE